MSAVLARLLSCVPALAALGGCFVELNAGLYPEMTVETTPVAPRASVSHDEAAVVFGINVGAYLDLYGVGVHYGFLGQDTVRNAGGVPERFGGSGYWLRLDADLPIRFADGWIGLRATYAYDSYDGATVGPNVDGMTQSVAGGGRGHFGGISFALPGNDISLALGARTFLLDTEPQTDWPGFRTSGTGPAARLMIRWIPTGALWAKYKPPMIESVQAGGSSSCPFPKRTQTCNHHQSGYRCYETTSCY